MLTRGRLAVVRTPDHIPTSILCEGARRTLSCVCMKEQLQNRKWKLHDPLPQQKKMRADGLEAGRSDDVPNEPLPPAKLAAYFSKHRGGQSATAQNPWCVKKPGGTYQHDDHPGCFA